MRWIREHKLFSIVVATVFILVIIVISAYASGTGTGGLRGILNTVSKPFSYVGGSLKNGFEGIFNYKKLQMENERLQSENEKLKQEINENSVSRDELNRLEALSKQFNSGIYRGSGTPVAANVINADNSKYFREFTIDAGADKGLKKGNIVIDQNGAVGTVTDVSKNSATVSSILDSNVSTSFVVKKNMDILGVLKGDGNETLKGYLLDEKASVVEGDILLTSGRGAFPKGVEIGKVTKVEYDSNTQLKVVQVKPTANFKVMQEVVVIR